MVNEVERYQKLRKKADDLKRSIDQNKGRADQMLSRIKDLVGVDDIDEAKEKLEEMRVALFCEQSKLKTASDEFEEKWQEKLS